MKVQVVGGGPAGLYLAILLRKADPAIEVQVLERNAPDATFGWGVVFSEETLGALRDADHETYVAITDTFARWDRVDIRYRDRILQLARTLVLGDRAQAAPRDPPATQLRPRRRARASAARSRPCPAGADLVVGADGVNSVVRRAHESRVRHASRAGRLQVRLVRHRPRLRRLHVRLPRNGARSLPGARVPLRRAHEHVHRRVPRGHLETRRPTRAGRGREPRRFASTFLRETSRGTSSSPIARSGSTSRRSRTRRGTTAAPSSSATPPTRRTSRSGRARSSPWRTRSRSATLSCAGPGTSRLPSSTTSSSAGRSSSEPSRRRARAPRTSRGSPGTRTSSRSSSPSTS